MNNTPPKWEELTPELKDAFTMENTIGMENWYIDGTISINKHDYDINKLIIDAENKNANYYGETDIWLYEALNNVSIKNKTVAVIGSVVPWYESIVLAYGGIPITVEYNLPGYNHPKITEILLTEVLKSNMKFDYAISISSIEHDGLGRYGDPLNPDGDIRAMSEIKTLLNPEGLLFMAVPVGLDKIVWNAHRIYGNKRLPKLLKNWKVVRTIGYEKDSLFISNGYILQPIIVLK